MTPFENSMDFYLVRGMLEVERETGVCIPGNYGQREKRIGFDLTRVLWLGVQIFGIELLLPETNGVIEFQWVVF